MGNTKVLLNLSSCLILVHNYIQYIYLIIFQKIFQSFKCLMFVTAFLVIIFKLFIISWLQWNLQRTKE